MSGLYPGDARSLTDPAALVEKQQYAVLAALTLRAGDPDALGALTSATDDWRAFAWMWSVFNPADPRHCQQLSENLAANITVPENLRDAVSQFVLTPSPQPATSHGAYPQQADGAVLLRRAAQVRLLAHLDPHKDYARGLARAVLEAEEGRYWPELRHAAFDVMGASRRKAERSYVFERAAELSPRDRLRPLLALALPYLKGEEAEIYSTLREALPVAGPFAVGAPGPTDYWGFARELTARLEASRVEEVLGAPWAQNETDRANFLSGGFVQNFGQEKVRALLASDLSEPVRRHLLRVVAAELPIEAQANLGRWTHENLDPEWSQPLRDRLSSDARPSRYGPRSPHQERALEALQDFALACEDPKTAADYAACLDPGEAPSLAREALASAPSPVRVGRIAGELLRCQEGIMRKPEREEAFREDVVEMLDLYPGDEDRALFLFGMFSEEPVEEGELSDLGFLGPKLLGRPESTRAFVEAGHGYDLVPAAYDAGDQAGAFLGIAEAAIEHLGDDALEAVMLQCSWSARGPEDRYRCFVDALRRRPDALLEEAVSALASLTRPDAEAAPTGHLRIVLGAAVETAADRLAGMVSGDSAAHLRRLLDQRDAELRRLALVWAAAVTPDEDLISLLVEKKGSTRGLEEDFGRVLREHACRLAHAAGDASAGWEERARALALAWQADEGVAREAAFGLAEVRSAQLRRRAASVIAETEGRSEEEGELRRLLDEESDAETGEKLTAALRNISSGSAGRALENLDALVGLSPRATPDVRTMLPDEGWDSRFVECVDRARRRRAGDPGAYVDALITLAELLVEVAVAERHDVAPENSPLGRRGPSHAEAIRSNSRSKPDLGELIRRQNLTEAFPWFRQVAILREMRGAHPAPLGSTDPVRVGNDELAYAQRLARDVVSGWERSMEETRGMGA